MSINTKGVKNRRRVSYSSYDDLLADVEQLAEQETRTLGNWSFAQVVEHLAIALEGSIDGVPFKAPWPMRTFAKVFLKKKFLHGSLSPGFQIPDSVKSQISPDQSARLEAALEHLRRAIARCKDEPQRAVHPLFDSLPREQWDLFNLRHAEMHMSFVKPKAN